MKKEISEDDDLVIGDVIEFHFKMRLAFIAPEWRKKKFIDELKEDSRYKILKIIWNDVKKRLVVKVKIVQNPLVCSLILVSIIVCGGGTALYLTTDKIYKIISTPFGALLPIALLVIAFGYYKYQKK